MAPKGSDLAKAIVSELQTVQTVITVDELLRESYALVQGVRSGAISPAVANAQARGFACIAKFLDLRCRYGGKVLTIDP